MAEEEHSGTEIENNEGKWSGFTATIEQSTTRRDRLELNGEEFSKDEIDFSAIKQHGKVHHGGEVAGSMFNGELFTGTDEIIALLKAKLPEEIEYDVDNRAELTLEITNPENQPIGWSVVVSKEELAERLSQVEISREPRFPGGEPAEVDGIKGSWYPEMTKNPDTGRFEVALNKDGSVKNPHGKFEPDANIAHVSQEEFEDGTASNLITLIIEKDRTSNIPFARTAFPGENAPPFPAKIDSENYKIDSLSDPRQTKFWESHVFLKIK